MWATGAREETLTYLREFTARLSHDLELYTNVNRVQMSSAQQEDFTRLLARCYFKLGEWQVALQPDWGGVRGTFKRP
jgi:FKBP12-rapamycin complex-associated protein